MATGPQILLAGQSGVLPKISLVSWYDFQESSGTTYADSHGGNSMTADNTISAGTGKVGNGKSNSRSALKTSATGLPGGSASRYTVAFWHKHSYVSPILIGPSIDNGGNASIDFGFVSGSPSNVSLTHRDSSSSRTDINTTGVNAGDNAYHFIVGWYDGVNINLQVDNGTIFSTARLGSDAQITNTAIRIGTGTEKDSLGVWTRVLSAAERTYLYNSGSGKNYAGL